MGNSEDSIIGKKILCPLCRNEKVEIQEDRSGNPMFSCADSGQNTVVNLSGKSRKEWLKSYVDDYENGNLNELNQLDKDQAVKVVNRLIPDYSSEDLDVSEDMFKEAVSHELGEHEIKELPSGINRKLARKIAYDHLKEDLEYYNYLKCTDESDQEIKEELENQKILEQESYESKTPDKEMKKVISRMTENIRKAHEHLSEESGKITIGGTTNANVHALFSKPNYWRIREALVDASTKTNNLEIIFDLVNDYVQSDLKEEISADELKKINERVAQELDYIDLEDHMEEDKELEEEQNDLETFENALEQLEEEMGG